MNRHVCVFLTGIWLSLPWIGAASAQTVQQSGSVTRNHIPVWVTSGVIADGGSSADSPISSLGVTNNGGSGICVNSARQTAAGYVALCLGSSTTGPATISLQNFGTAAAQNLQFVINGTTFPFPGSLANITIGVTPVVGGTNTNCLFVSGGFVGQQPCQLSAITSLTGDVTGTGPGVTATTLATVNPNVGTFGNGTTVPSITVNGKGLITAVSTSPVSMTVATSLINAGGTNELLYDNAGVLGALGTLANSVLVTNGTGVPSISQTLPSALTIPSPTFTGTETFPDAATWTNLGITKAVAISVGSATLPGAGNVSISGQYQVNGTQIAASNLSNGTTGSGAVVLAAGPTISGTWAGAATFSGALTLSGNDTFTAQAIFQGTSAPVSAAGNTVVMGTILAPTLTNNGQAFVYNTAVNGAVLEGAGSTYDSVMANKSGTAVIGIGTGTTVPVLPGLANGTCSSGLALDASNNVVKTSCPGAAASIQVGTTTITAGASGNIEFNNAGTLGEVTPQNGVAIVSTGLVGNEAVNPQTGTTYAINNTDRGKLITASNAAAQAYSIAQAGTAGLFAAGYATEIRNIQPTTQTAAVVTITPTTSTICGGATKNVYPGGSLKIVSDGTNYLCPFEQTAQTLSNFLGSNASIANGSFSDGPSVAQGTTGTWLATGTVTFTSTTSPSQMICKLWDGTNVIAASDVHVTVANDFFMIALSGVLATPAGNIKISCQSNSAGASFQFNNSGTSKDAGVTVYRIG